MSNFDRNRWYHIHNLVDTPRLSMSAMLNYNSTGDPNNSGYVRMSPSNGTVLLQRWQIWTHNTSYYALRSAAGTGSRWMRVGNILPRNDAVTRMYEESVNMRDIAKENVDQELLDAMLWKVGEWPDGSCYFTNAANGTGFLLVTSDLNPMIMERKTDMPGKESRFKFEELEPINDPVFSVGIPSLSNPTSVATVPSSTSSPDFDSTAISPTSPPDLGSGMSKGATTALQASLGTCSLLVLIGLCFFLYPRYWNWLHRFTPVPKVYESEEANELHANHIVELEVQPAELKAGTRHLTAELPGDEIAFIPRAAS
ncbi:hypothetical protein VTL71DRAFT_1884 [Oculimacula yallundae]|uniref:Uncharacterized protein n=1 Tax=Oculimacula yallundae TaxID=86028 RepID=A0ABR4CE31_9HELO